MKKKSDKAYRFYVWFDAEYSSLELEKAYLLQVAALITDTSLRRVLPPERDVRATIRLPNDVAPSSWVEQNLPDLLKACRSPSAVDIADADNLLADYVDAVAGLPAEQENQRPVMAGNSIHEDWWLVRRFLPRFMSRLHYRHVDVSTVKLEWKRLNAGSEFDKENPDKIRRYFPEAVFPDSCNLHDAYYDVQASIAELAFYRAHLFHDQPL